MCHAEISSKNVRSLTFFYNIKWQKENFKLLKTWRYTMTFRGKDQSIIKWNVDLKPKVLVRKLQFWVQTILQSVTNISGWVSKRMLSDSNISFIKFSVSLIENRSEVREIERIYIISMNFLQQLHLNRQSKFLC